MFLWFVFRKLKLVVESLLKQHYVTFYQKTHTHIQYMRIPKKENKEEYPPNIYTVRSTDQLLHCVTSSDGTCKS